MLLDLFDHQRELFVAAIESLIWARDFRSLAALRRSCSRLCCYVNLTPIWRHRAKYKNILSHSMVLRAQYDVKYFNHYGQLSIYLKPDNRLVTYEYNHGCLLNVSFSGDHYFDVADIFTGPYLPPLYNPDRVPRWIESRGYKTISYNDGWADPPDISYAKLIDVSGG